MFPVVEFVVVQGEAAISIVFVAIAPLLTAIAHYNLSNAIKAAEKNADLGPEVGPMIGPKMLILGFFFQPGGVGAQKNVFGQKCFGRRC